MIALLTSCGRQDLLLRTIESFYKNQRTDVNIIIHEDSKSEVSIIEATALLSSFQKVQMTLTEGMGQHRSIEKFLFDHPEEKYFVHLEEDWEFENTYDWIQKSIEIMETCPEIIKVICRSDSSHPCIFDRKINEGSVKYTHLSPSYGVLHPFRNSDGHLWHGFGFNPGVTRLDYLIEIIPFGKFEQDVSEQVWKAGYQTALLKNGVCKHIGQGRTTVLGDPAKK